MCDAHWEKRLGWTILAFFLGTWAAQAQLAVTVSPPKLTGNLAVVKLQMRNRFAGKIVAARAVCFLVDGHGKMLAVATRWVIGGARSRPALAPKQTRAFNFVVAGPHPFTTTNVTARLLFNRLVLNGGRQVNPAKEVTVKPAEE